MGSTLTNTQPKDTYKSLLKTSDSSELSATAKYVSDGNGNDSKLALSTGNVGINTTSPAATLDVNGTIYSNNVISVNNNGYAEINWRAADNTLRWSVYKYSPDESGTVDGSHLNFSSYNNSGGYNQQVMSFRRNTGFVQINQGLTFGSDTAAANALDDYEEGTWTPSLGGNATYLAQSGTYTKIGRVVTFKALVYVNVIGTGSTTTISGLPFAIAADGGAVCSVPHYSGVVTSVSSVNGNVTSTSIAVNSNVGNTTTNQTLNAIFQNSTYFEIAGTYQV